MLVTSPASTPVSELIDTAHELTTTLGVSLTPVVVNGVDTFDPPCNTSELLSVAGDDAIRDAARFRLARIASHHDAIEELKIAITEPHLEIPLSMTDPTADELVPDVARALRIAITMLDDTQ
jgi:hypothetical protein